MRKVLNVGGGSRETPLPPMYAGWKHVLLDIDPRGEPDVVCDARELSRLPGGEYDAVYCSHNLEHYYRHDVPKVLAGFLHVLKEDGFAHVHVPDMEQVMRIAVQKGLDIDDTLYQTVKGPVTVRDVIYGYGVEIEKSGLDFWAHKTGFTPRSLHAMLTRCGFPQVFVGTSPLETIAFAFKSAPTEFARTLIGLRQTP